MIQTWQMITCAKAVVQTNINADDLGDIGVNIYQADGTSTNTNQAGKPHARKQTDIESQYMLCQRIYPLSGVHHGLYHILCCNAHTYHYRPYNSGLKLHLDDIRDKDLELSVQLSCNINLLAPS